MSSSGMDLGQQFWQSIIAATGWLSSRLSTIILSGIALFYRTTLPYRVREINGGAGTGLV
jgi:hypothetical protein